MTVAPTIVPTIAPTIAPLSPEDAQLGWQTLLAAAKQYREWATQAKWNAHVYGMRDAEAAAYVLDYNAKADRMQRIANWYQQTHNLAGGK